jgi:CHAT domain-containing protein/tetratricopeptide (TPR) repeat protein
LANQLDDERIATWALLGLARIRYRLVGSAEARRLHLEAEQRAPPEDAYLQSRLRCARAESVEEVEAGAANALEAGIRRLQAACLHIAANIHINRGETGRAAYVLMDVEGIQREIGDRAGRAATLQWLGYNLRINNNLEGARMFLTEAVLDGIASQSLAPVAWARLNLGQIRLMVGDLAGALAYADTAEAFFRRQGDQWGMATLLETRGLAATNAGDFSRAQQALEEALRLYTVLGNGPGIIGVNTGLFNIALAREDLAEAEVRLTASQFLARRQGMTGWQRSLLFEEADLALRQGDLRRAESALEEILSLPEHPRRQYVAKVRLAEIRALEGAVDESLAILRDALARLDRWRQEAGLPELKRFAFQALGRSVDPDLGVATIISEAAAAGRTSDAFEVAEAQRARELFDRLVRESLVEPVSIDSILANLPEEGVSWEGPPEWTPPARAGDLQAALPDAGTALVEFVVGLGGEPTTAFVLTRQSIRALSLPPVDSLGPVISRFRVLVESDTETGNLASDLGDALMGRVVESLGPEIERIILVPDGALHRVPFDALQLEDGRLLTETFGLSLAPSGAVAAHLWSQPPAQREARILALGDPAFTDEAGAGVQTGPIWQAFEEAGGLSRLEGSGREARRIFRFAEEGEIRLRERASEAFLKSGDLTPYRVLHLATHSLVSEGAVGRTALALAPDSTEDGLLLPSDLAHLRLDADLVVLSACRTAGGVLVRGEGVQGLTAPILRAGARSVLATTWPVEDRATLRILEGVYGGLADGLSVGEALQEAKVSAIEAGAPVSEWGAFVLVGNPAVRIPLSRPRSLPTYLTWFLALLIGVPLAYFIYSRHSGRRRANQRGYDR